VLSLKLKTKVTGKNSPFLSLIFESEIPPPKKSLVAAVLKMGLYNYLIELYENDPKH
jgi:hypothetical protein